MYLGGNHRWVPCTFSLIPHESNMLTELLAVGSNQAEKRDLFASFYDQKKSKLTTGNSWTFTLTRNFGCRKVNLAYPPKGPVFFMEFTVKLTKP